MTLCWICYIGEFSPVVNVAKIIGVLFDCLDFGRSHMKRSLTKLALAFAAGSVLLQASDWPQFRGPDRKAISSETGLLQEWPSEGPQLLWKVDDIGHGYGTVAVVGDTAYLVANSGMDREYVTALSVSDGSKVWSTDLGPIGKPNQLPSYASARSTPTIVDDTLYALSSNGDLVSIQLATGEILWRKSLPDDFGGESGTWAYAESPLVDGDTLVVAPGGSTAAVIALNRQTGEPIWKTSLLEGEVAGYASTIITEAGGLKQYVTFLDKGIIGVDAATGDVLWRYGGTASGPANIPTPVVDGDYVYSSNARRFGGALVRIDSNSDGLTAEEVYFQRSSPNTLGGQVLLDGNLYGTNSDGLVATNFLSGAVLWQSEGGPGSIQYADGRFYVHWEDGDVSLVAATTEAFDERGRFTPPDAPAARDTGRPKETWTYPVVANGKLYIRDLGTIWCYDVSATSGQSR